MSLRTSLRSFAFLASVVAIVGCGGHGSVSSLPTIALPAAPGSSNSASSRAHVTVSVLVPTLAPLARRRPLYVSTATQSLALAIGSQNLGSLDVGPNSPDCKPATAGYACTGAFDVPIGTNTFTLSAYDAPKGTGKILSTATVAATIVAGSANTIAVTLDGVIASLALALPTTPIVQGTPTTLPLTITARDADGRTIVGDPYASPIALSGGDPKSAALSATTVASPADQVSIAYDGSRLTPLTFTATVAGAPAASISLAAPKTPFTDDWLVFAHDAQHTGADANEPALSPTNVGQLQQLYSVTMTSFVNAQPMVATNVLNGGAYRDIAYVGDEHGKFVAFDVKDGTVLWSKQLGTQSIANCTDIPDGVFGITGTAEVDRASNRVYVVDGLSVLWAFDLATGQIAAQSGSLASWPAQGLPLLGALGTPSTEHVYGALTYNPTNGDLYAATGSICDHGTWNGRIVAINVASASIAKSFITVQSPAGAYGGGIWGPGGVSLDPRGNGDVYTAIGNAEPIDSYGLGDTVAHWDANLNLRGANLPDTSTNTSTRTDLDFGATPVLFQAPGCGVPQLAVIQKSGNAFVYALDSLTGSGAPPLQSQSIPISISSADGINIGIPAYADGTVFISNGWSNGPPQGNGEQRGLIAYADNGCVLQKKWAFVDPKPYGGPNSSPTVANGIVYEGGGSDGVVRAFDENTGSVLWTSAPSGMIFTAPTVADGKLLVSSWDGSVHVYGAATVTSQSIIRR